VDGFLVQPKKKTENDIWTLKCQEKVEVAAGILSQYNLDLMGVQVHHFGKPGKQCVCIKTVCMYIHARSLTLEFHHFVQRHGQNK